MGTSLKQLLVHFDDSPAALQRLRIARRIAAEHDALVTGLYAVIPALMDTPFAAEAGAAAVSALGEIDEDRMKRAKAAFDLAMDESPGTRAHWAQVARYPVASAFGEQALYADLVVIGQPDTSDAQAPAAPFDLVETTVVASGKPALVVPFAGSFDTVGQAIVIAWKPTREAARAVAAAVPLMRKARQVHIVSWGGPNEPSIRGSRLDLDGYLRQRGVEATWHRDSGPEPQPIGEMLLSRAADLAGDLLVMGCWGHSRAREWVLGGASRTVLRSMTMPVLMAH